MSAAAQRDLTCREYGDAGLLVDFGDADPGRRWERAQSLGDALRRAAPLGLVDVVASFQSVFVSFDPLVTDRAAMEEIVQEVAAHPPAPRPSRLFVVPVVYGGDHGPDLEETADLLGLSPGRLVERHSAQVWVVRFVGSPAGAPLMDGPRLPASVPRRAVPRPVVPPGSVGVSGFQSIVYNAASPGGWQLIGRSPAVLFDLGRTPPVEYAAGDRVRFLPVGPDDWGRWAGRGVRPENPVP